MKNAPKFFVSAENLDGKKINGIVTVRTDIQTVVKILAKYGYIVNKYYEV